MAFNNEIEKVKAEIKVLEKKLSLLEEIENHKTPCEKAYRDAYGFYPITDCMSGGSADYVSWDAFQKGYNAAKRKETKSIWNTMREKLGFSIDMCDEIVDAIDELEFQPTPQTPEQVENGLKEAFRKAIKEGIIPEVKQPTDELIDKLVENPPSFLKFELGKTLEDIVNRWWCDTFTGSHENWSMEECIDDLVDQIQLWLPKEQSAAGSQSLGVEDMVEGFNDAIKKIKSKLRNKRDT